ncbi:DUF4132 domain-containing protein [Nonomuraea harbinensis]|uniref:DUF4132 domain-containing protein n=1 Tax=Nonomuraea harbinensis TaxID=1286938 RepID=A0ABW1C222_9ACTN|nr:DUF4132 domain-containing protein [Nonomuraea harbinensis]
MLEWLHKLETLDRAMDDLHITAHDERERIRAKAHTVLEVVHRHLAKADRATCREAAVRLARLRADAYGRELSLAVHRGGAWTPAEMTELFAAARKRRLDHGDVGWISHLAGESAALPAEARHEPWKAVEPLFDAIEECPLSPDERKGMQRALARVNPSPLALPLGRDGWGAAVRDHLGEPPAPHLVALVEHLGVAGGPRPAKAWRARCLELLAGEGAGELVAAGLRAFDGARYEGGRHGGPARLLMTDVNTDVARGFAWAAALARVGGAAPALTRLVLAAGGHGSGTEPDLKLASGVVHALAECEGAVDALRRLQQDVRSRSLLKQIAAALATAAARHGVTAAQLVERGVPGHGLSADGSRDWADGAWTVTVTVTVEDARTVRVTARDAGGRTRRGLPSGLAAAGEIKALVKEVRHTLSAERDRLEALFGVERSWPPGEWARLYRDHPVTGAVARALIWHDGAPFLPGDREPGGGVTLWHPARAPMEEIRAWRETVAERRLRQPFKQAYREVYALTPAEEHAACSGRFAARRVGHDRLYALAKQRGWQPAWLRHHGEPGEAWKELAEGAWRVRFGYELTGDAAYATTGQVRFDRRDGRQWRETPLAGVPPLVFSEAMRDVDLFVADPARDGDRHARSAEAYELPASARVRRDALERILPGTAIAGRCTLTDRHLVVRGDLRTYKIHLGGAGVLMEPGDVPLSIAGARKPGGRIFLPFEEDGTLALILAKAFLLAADTGITDESLMRQISWERSQSGLG